MNNPNLVKQQELNRSLTNLLNKSVDENILNKIRDLDSNSVPPTPTILPHSLSQSPENTTTPVYPTINRSLPKPNPLHANTGLYFRDILKQPEESVVISQSIRTRGTRFPTSP